ncbi:MAG TPA: beta-galactosidase trimerization domain-containing protein [Candidatus Synoicihabitans sp.]|nr:beta-galactosidase trimerization domain-containing protein [Candidatus Synoicihabitans sp.]
MRSQARVAIYHSRASQTYAAATATRAEQATCFRAAYRVLLESRIPFDFVSDRRMSDADVAEQLSRYDVIVMPNVACLSTAEAAALDAFVARGGTLIASGETGLYDERGQRRDGFALESFPARNISLCVDKLKTYVRVAEHELHFPKTRLLHLDGWYFYVEAKEDAAGQLSLLPPQRYGPPELCFPDVADNESPGILRRRHGRGQAIYLPWLPEWIYYRDGLPEHRELIAQLVLESAPLPVKVEGIGPVEVTIHRRAAGRGGYLIHLVNYSGQRNNVFEQPVPLRGFKIGVKGARGPARSLIGGQAIAVAAPDVDGYAWMEIPEIGTFQAILAEATA